MGKYELLSAIKPNLDNDEADKVVAKIEDVIRGFGGSVTDTEKMGRKKSAYDIQGYRDGYFVVQKMTLPEDKVVDFKRQLRLNENIIRTVFTKIKKA
ncbi:MAG: 30S ribosomal protein S6 [Candidatus Gastranaerophilales bacterium]|nr:30S ribosomal protein S6 [Candidatus Gastranaerophilales bacterium]